VEESTNELETCDYFEDKDSSRIIFDGDSREMPDKLSHLVVDFPSERTLSKPILCQECMTTMNLTLRHTVVLDCQMFVCEKPLPLTT